MTAHVEPNGDSVVNGDKRHLELDFIFARQGEVHQGRFATGARSFSELKLFVVLHDGFHALHDCI